VPPANVVEPLLERHPVQPLDGQAEKEPHARADLVKDSLEGPPAGLQVALDGGGILEAQVGRDRLPWPHRACLACGPVAEGEDEVERRGVRTRELAPALAVKPLCRNAGVP